MRVRFVAAVRMCPIALHSEGSADVFLLSRLA